MANKHRSRHIIKLNPEQIETLIHEAVIHHPFQSPERASLLAMLFNNFFIPCADIYPDKDWIATVPSLNIIAQDEGLINYFSEFSNMIVRITSKNRHFITLANPTMVDAIIKMDPKPQILTFGNSFIVPEELCDPGCFAVLNILFEEYLWNASGSMASDKTESLASVVRSYLLCQDMWTLMPKTIQPFYHYLDPLTPAQIFSMVGYPEKVIEEIDKTIGEYRKNIRDKDEGDFTE